MDKDKASKIARQYINFIKKREPDIQKAYLFGSYVKGTGKEDSDEADFQTSNPFANEVLNTGLEII